MGDLMIRVCTKALDGNDARAMMANGDILEERTQENMWKHVLLWPKTRENTWKTRGKHV